MPKVFWYIFKTIILQNFLKVHFFSKISTNASMRDCIFPMRPLCSQEPEFHLERRHIVFIYNLYVNGVVVLGGKALIFTLMLI